MEKYTRAHKKNGFTLIELVVVLFIIGIASTLVGIALSQGFDTIQLKTSAKEIAATLRYARSQAVAEKKSYSFLIDKNGYELVTEGYDESTGTEASASVMGKRFTRGVSSGSEEGKARIDFFPLGDSTGGEILLRNQKGGGFWIIIERLTGKVRIETAKE